MTIDHVCGEGGGGLFVVAEDLNESSKGRTNAGWCDGAEVVAVIVGTGVDAVVVSEL